MTPVPEPPTGLAPSEPGMGNALGGLGPVLVTGATGFVGAHVVKQLAGLGARVVASTRDGRAGTRALDMRDGGAFAAALAGVGAVVHCAVGDRQVTVDGSHALLSAAAAAGVKRFVHLSSIAVYGGAAGRVAEDTPMVSADRRDYAGWKAAAEQACLAESALRAVRLRPSIVYGPGGSYWLDSMTRRIASGRWGTFGAAGEGTCNLVHVDDVVGAIAASLVSPGAPGQAFNVNGPETVSWNGYFVTLAKAMKRPPLPEISAIGLQARLAASLPLKLLHKLRPGLVGELLLGVPGRSDVSLFARRVAYPTDAAREGLGWRPSVNIDEGLARSLAA